MKLLRTISTQRLLAIIAGLVLAVAGGTAIAFAAAGNGQKPPRESLATALHQAATAPAVTALSARISFTDNLIDSTALQGSDPILSGASGRLWLSTTTHQLRLELQGQNGDAQVLVKNGAFSIYDPMSNTVYKGTLPTGASQASKSDKSATDAIPSVAQIQSELNQLMAHVDIAGPLPRNVAGQEAYKIVLTPKHSGGLLGSVQLAWDATHGVPLGIAIYSANGNGPNPVLELKATQIKYAAVSPKVFTIKPPAGAKVVRISSPAHAGAPGIASTAHGKAGRGKRHAKAAAEITGAAAVQAHVPFTLADPGSLQGLKQQSVQLLDWGGSPAALVTYGEGLGGIAVIEQTASNQSSSGSQNLSGLNLPTESINGHSAQELPTALGTVLRLSSGGVEYTLLASMPASAAEAAAGQLVPATP